MVERGDHAGRKGKRKSEKENRGRGERVSRFVVGTLNATFE